eukprot:TRINITY_DN2792_c0_g1_i1.p1 TRINITY_DN2792_c0_g1~~TRINITY_DN2792_c0_g1_i1.p1  ORF type:complete len:254 (-),score=48.35 TRINITY_DN2792_c0_g1_i1:120-881(-)
MIRLFLFFTIITLVFGRSTCKQAWNGSGTGAWYRLDVDCRYSNLVNTTMAIKFPQVHKGIPGPAVREGFYMSGGIYDTKVGLGADIGLTLSGGKWWPYFGDCHRWMMGNKFSIDPVQFPMVKMIWGPMNRAAFIKIEDLNGNVLGTQIFDDVTTKMNYNDHGIDMSFYMFFSIAQKKEYLSTQSRLDGASILSWSMTNVYGTSFEVSSSKVAQSVWGYQPGPCCSEEEKKTIHVSGSIHPYSTVKDISIVYDL